MKNLMSFVFLSALFICSSVSALTVAGATQFNRSCDLITWKDHLGKDRQAYLVKSGDHLGVIQRFTYYDGAALKDIVPGNPDNDPLNSAFGSTTHHGAGCHYCGGTLTKRMQGDAMVIYDWNITVDGVKETVTYTFMDGHDYFQWAQTDDVKNGITADSTHGGGDTRGPYCTMNWNGTGNAAQGVAYGATKYYWQPVWNGPWTFKDTCDIPYAWEWGDGLEIGYIATQTRRQQLAGCPVWAASLNMPASGTSMPFESAWMADFQMNFYDQWLKITWGLPYNYLCSNGGPTTGQKPAGGQYWGQYSLSIVLDAKTADGVMRVMKENRALHNRTFTYAATTGTLKGTGPMGTKNPNNQNLAPIGYDHNYRVFWITTANASAAVTFTITSDTVRWVNPTFKLAGLTADPTRVVWNGTALAKGTDFVTSVFSDSSQVWLTLLKTISGATNTLVIGENTGIDAPVIRAAKGIGIRIEQGSATLRMYDARGILVASTTINAAKGAVVVTPESVKSFFKTPAQGTYVVKARINGIDEKLVAIY